MTDAEITRRVAEWMGYAYLRDVSTDTPGECCIEVRDPVLGLRMGFDPLHNADDEQRVREWALAAMSPFEHQDVQIIVGRVARERHPENNAVLFGLRTGDLTRAVAQVLAKRSE